jgi:5-(carboxyamino)imidazole ribonucleotide synthase
LQNQLPVYVSNLPARRFKTMKQTIIGILGGGQLGKMLILEGLHFDLQFRVLDPDPLAPCHVFSGFTAGSITDYDTVMDFGKGCDILTIEIENVNVEALRDLAAQGKKVFPQPEAIALIQDKRLQKKFYEEHGFSTAPFVLTGNRSEVQQHVHLLPAVHKLGREGYDGRGVQIIRSADELHLAFDAPAVLEKFIDCSAELAVIAARNEKGEVRTFPPVQMVFHPEKNLVGYLFSPAQVDEPIRNRAGELARSLIERLGVVGLLAVEMFVTTDGNVLINEVAPRPHNSGHHTLEGNITSQYEQHLRAIMGWPLGDTSIIRPSAMINLLGEPGYAGPARYVGLEEVLQLNGVYVHLYGKLHTRPFRKMGHVTVTDEDMEQLRQKADFVKKTLKVIA